MKLFKMDFTTFASDPTGRGRSYTVYTTKTGRKFYTNVAGLWYYAKPVRPTGFRVAGRVDRNVVARLGLG